MLKKIVCGVCVYSSVMYAQVDNNITVDTNTTDNNTTIDNNITKNTSKVFEQNSDIKKDVNNLLDINAQLENINQLAIHKKEKEALLMVEKLYHANPTHKDIAHTYAKLLFWGGDVLKASEILQKSKEYDSKLAKQIYISKTINDLKQTKSSSKQLSMIKDLKTFAQNDYEVLWIMMKAYIKKHQYYHALKTAQKISKLYPKSIEAKESVARLYFWTHNYHKSLATYNSLKKISHKRYTKEIRQLKDAIYTRAKRKKAKLVQQDKKKIFETNDDLQYKVMQQALNQRTKEYMVGIGYDYFRFSDKRYTDNTKYIEATIPIGDFILYNKLEDTHRYGMHDTKYSAELYPTMPKPWWGYLSFSFTPSAEFFSKYSIGWHQYYDVGSWEFGLGYTYAKYSTLHTNTLIGLYTYYFTDRLYFTQTLYYVTDNKSWSVSNKLDYKISKHYKYYISYIKSDSYESEDEISIAHRNNIKSDKFQMGVEFPIDTHYHCGMDVSYEKFDTKNVDYNRKELNVYMRYYW